MRPGMAVSGSHDLLFNQAFTLQFSNHSLGLPPSGVKAGSQDVQGRDGLHDKSWVRRLYGLGLGFSPDHPSHRR